ncbi:MAG: DEAD/DEAH box helicase family protein [Lentisphaeria bacterium]|nr:DEAD/DEAH box helicase family protein [Lentisphaeria bacterium]
MGRAPQQYVNLENRLLLLAWLNSLLGYANNRELLEDIAQADEGYDDDGRSHIYQRLASRGGKLRIPLAELARYDDNIRKHLAAINARRGEPISLRYFQYLAALYTEITLDRYFNQRPQLLADLQAFVQARNDARPTGEAEEEPFKEADLGKLAFWMATGSGKTLILHLNYRQFLHYNQEKLDNILLITPNRALSEQHLAELEASDIPAQRFDLNHASLWSSRRNIVQLIEITKLVEEKRGGGLSVPVEAFEGNNLVFVDEGHKGSGGEAWRSYREALGASGFTFEYSATFGQALTAARNDRLSAEYGKAIIFDYSYRYFYGDGYGKDFRILNLTKQGDESKTELLFLGNLLSFYEQQCVFAAQAEALRPYKLEKPLWVFVGSSVNAVYSENRQSRSDVLSVARFLHRVLSNQDNWVSKGIKKLLTGKSDLQMQGNMDLFADRFQHLRESGRTAQSLYNDILSRVFNARASGGLHLCALKNAPGEMGLKAAGADDYFGLVYIGDTSRFKKLVQEDESGITLEEDALSTSLFEGINEEQSPIAMLIGAKKFMEGWNSWRVSNMGLFNIGRHEGSQIIQLFGRGVRLRGRDCSLKRSAALPGKHPKHIRLLETLNIFALRANYMAQFRSYLEREGVETEPLVELPLFVWANEQFLQRGLLAPRPAEGRDFVAETAMLLAVETNLRPRVDLSLRVQTLEGNAEGLQVAQTQAGARVQIPEENLALVDWEMAYLELLEHKRRRGWSNLVIRPETLPRILAEVPYSLLADEELLHPSSFADRQALQETVAAILKKYLERFYRRRHKRWDSENLVYRPLDLDDPNLAFNRPSTHESKAAYTVRVPSSCQALIAAIEQLNRDMDAVAREENDVLPHIHFERHLYLPLLLKGGALLNAVPSSLEASEAQFVRDLKGYWEKEKDRALKDQELFLLRNLSRGKGVGFFEESGFYPDFILWVVDKQSQRIVFIEPHGMLHAKAYVHDDKARLWERLPELAREIGKRSDDRRDIFLDSYVVSATVYEDLYQSYDDGTWNREKFAQHHILFPERNQNYDYLKLLFT